MTQKILVTLEVDDRALDVAQAKADILIAQLKHAEVKIEDIAKKLDRLQAKEKPPEGGSKTPAFDVATRLARDIFKPPD